MAFSFSISITPEGETEPFVLVESPDEAPVEGTALVEDRVVQISEVVRGESALVIGRGNRRTAFEFTATRQHANLGEAIAFSFGHAGEVPLSGTVEVVVEDGAVERTFRGAGVVERVELLRRRGLTTIWRYRLVVRGLEEVV